MATSPDLRYTSPAQADLDQTILLGKGLPHRPRKSGTKPGPIEVVAVKNRPSTGESPQIVFPDDTPAPALVSKKARLLDALRVAGRDLAFVAKTCVFVFSATDDGEIKVEAFENVGGGVRGKLSWKGYATPHERHTVTDVIAAARPSPRRL